MARDVHMDILEEIYEDLCPDKPWCDNLKDGQDIGDYWDAFDLFEEFSLDENGDIWVEEKA